MKQIADRWIPHFHSEPILIGGNSWSMWHQAAGYHCCSRKSRVVSPNLEDIAPLLQPVSSSPKHLILPQTRHNGASIGVSSQTNANSILVCPFALSAAGMAFSICTRETRNNSRRYGRLQIRSPDSGSGAGLDWMKIISWAIRPTHRLERAQLDAAQQTNRQNMSPEILRNRVSDDTPAVIALPPEILASHIDVTISIKTPSQARVCSSHLAVDTVVDASPVGRRPMAILHGPHATRKAKQPVFRDWPPCLDAGSGQWTLLSNT